jgi:membrane-associated phospholipid phosphatase
MNGHEAAREDARSTPWPTPYEPLRPSRALARMVVGGLVLAFALTCVGFLITHVLTSSAGPDGEDRVNRWAVAHGSSALDSATHVGSYLAETVTCLVLLALAVPALRIWLGRWRESWAVFAAIVGELLVFLIVTALVDRSRPDVRHLDAAPPTSSFPSAHVGAAVAIYGCLALVVHREVRNRVLAWVVVVVGCALPVIVAVSRVYRGKHHPSDVVFGAVGGGLWLVVVVTTMLALPAGRSSSEDPSTGERRAGSRVTA